ncbi:hypothetical protein CRENBAI_001124 [Crenichthys baileyi]|uniref:Collagen IV NC1 domain-containing protein n=1 Tax=Crenichthys baileyi TaxID=28760 RepID=A0AAV9R9P4_9TELE
MEGVKGQAGNPGPSGRRGQGGRPGQKGMDRRPTVVVLPGDRGEMGDLGDVGKKGHAGCPGAKGPDGLKGTAGETGQRGQHGGYGLKGEDGDKGGVGRKGENGAKGQIGAKGPRGAQGEWGVPSGMNGFLFTRHSQDRIIPQCPPGSSFVFDGYSLLFINGYSRAHGQDLGTVGSCLQRFSTLPFLICEIAGECRYAERNDYSYWLSNIRDPQLQNQTSTDQETLQSKISRY